VYLLENKLQKIVKLFFLMFIISIWDNHKLTVDKNTKFLENIFNWVTETQNIRKNEISKEKFASG